MPKYEIEVDETYMKDELYMVFGNALTLLPTTVDKDMVYSPGIVPLTHIEIDYV